MVARRTKPRPRSGQARSWKCRSGEKQIQSGGSDVEQAWIPCLCCGPGRRGADRSPGAIAQQITVGLITKTDTNPFFVKMRQGAEAEAAKAGVKLLTYAGKYDGDNQAQVEAIESLIAAGAKGILITPSDTAAIVPTVKKAREAGILVIALDTPLNPIDAADATFATDNFKAGELIGKWAKATLGDKAAAAKIAMLDLSPAQVTVDVLRDQGFLTGFGIDVKDPKRIGDETDPRIVGHDVTGGAEEGGARQWRTCCRRIPTSTSSTPSTSLPPRAPIRR